MIDKRRLVALGCKRESGWWAEDSGEGRVWYIKGQAGTEAHNYGGP